MNEISKNKQIQILYILFFLVICSASLTYWQLSQNALNNWSIAYYKLSTYLDQVPAWQKLLKDFLALLLLIISIVVRKTNYTYTKQNFSLIPYFCVWLFIFALSIARSIESTLTLSALFVALRPYIFFISVFVFCYRHLHTLYIRKIYELINFVALIQVYFSLRQRWAAISFNGLTWFHSGSARSVGTFIDPNSLGLFISLVMYLNIFILPKKLFGFSHIRLIFNLFYCITIFLTGSRISQLIVTVLIFYAIYNEFIKGSVHKDNNYSNNGFLNFFAVVSVSLTIYFFLPVINALSGRTSSLSGNRYEIFLDYLNQADISTLLFGKFLGYGSNIIQTLNIYSSSNDVLLSDSTWLFVFAQFGIAGIFALFGFVYALLSTSKSYDNSVRILLHNSKYRSREYFPLYLYLLLGASTVILFELYAVLPILVSLIMPWQANISDDKIY